MYRLFIGPIIVSALALAVVYWFAGLGAFLLAATLAVLEVTLSFDNAVVNAKILGDMSPRWQKRFLTWGMLSSVVGTRLALPVLIVSAVTFVSPVTVAYLAVYNPGAYAQMLDSAGVAVKAFGGAFLLMVSLKFFFDITKDIHWFGPLERRLSRWGRVDAIEIALTLAALLAASYLAHDSALTIIRAGAVGLILFTCVEGLAGGLSGGLIFLASYLKLRKLQYLNFGY